ncbi:TetR/AcrR family transcriptional regulator C-terminal domain-containing protein [Spiractinospora alimapuensis]|uniref:TetR/AcrR family transcriptional regulator n=1 Tax=Spiractinospora alimapuensis TaxID=2820884 RepID=UPI001F1B2E37|nr:TetR/AcrR family transcriptional regulator [Spiractinospora alimapuensis]QVQ52818.1 TetR/AcrR family transcriptional regulator C-terminal domain-containing protein [Spiractinospora alimapuensis]
MKDERHDPDLDVELLWRPRRGLDLERIVHAAVEVADEDGLEGMSMRKVAERLGFTPMSLYRHVPGRDQLIDLMLDGAMARLPDPPTEGDWRSRLETCLTQGWELTRRHPWLAEARGTRRLPGPNTVARYERMLAILADTSLPPAEVIAALNVVSRFVDAEATALLEAARAERDGGGTDEEWWDARRSLFDQLDAHPTITALWEAGGWDDPVDTFTFGLARLLDGLEARIKTHEQLRDEMRDENCRVCGTPIDQPDSGRRRRYCSRACQQRAYRQGRSDREQ